MSGKCWAHADQPDLDAALEQLGANGRLDVRGVPISSELLRRLLDAAPHDERACCPDRLAIRSGDVPQGRAAVQPRWHGSSGDRLLRQTPSYVKHHLQLAGRSDPLFSDDALALLRQTSRGIPRAVNNLAVHALVATFADGKGMIDERAARAAIAEVTTE
jgi:hypothetical protein